MEEKFSCGIAYAVPRVDTFVGRPKRQKTDKFLTRTETIREFIKGEMFQNFCNHPDNGIRTGMVITIAVGPLAHSYPLVGGDTIDHLMIVIDCYDGLNLHQRRTNIGRQNERGNTQIYHSESFYVTFKNNRWMTVRLLANEGWRKQTEANEALLKWAELTRCKVIGKTMLMTGTIIRKGEEVCTSEMWAVEVVSEHGRFKHLAVMFENGKMIAGDATELQLSPKSVWDGAVMHAKYNWYRKMGGEFQFI